ncbi:MAG TPA: SUMF1/EgtB/PvdO family nonheme iron enzyme, partial [Holophaga sp.]|nr:SUMF1/EgtB/PvdO family nonheme iron enzyme [Holophaga sp.]
WNDTQAFIDWMNEKEPGRGYRLPTEAEWEYACRAGSSGTLPPAPMMGIAWIADNSTFRTHPVGAKQANAFGVHDMLGNAWEWCQDWYLYGYLAELDKDPQGPTWGTMKVIRGGGWRNLHAADKLLLVTRYYAGVREGSDDIGFRLAAGADGP